ncbi:MAG TPA: ABC transporter permease [Candidatus Binataceae bacterium]|nr:ABC transporter permease [Candidatus Binataceae bacterium]
MRLRGLLRKESLQILRDPSSIAIAFVMPVVLLLLFGYGVSLDAKRVPLALVVEQPNRDTANFIAGFFQSPYFVPVRFATIQEADAAMNTRRVEGIVWLRSNFSRQMLSGGNAPIGLIVNGVDANNARIIEGYIQQVWANWIAQFYASQGLRLKTPVQADVRIWFNPAVASTDFIVPGLIAVIMTLTGALLTAMVVAREWERGTMEALLVTPASIHEIILSKLVPYFVLGMGGMILSVMMALWLFAVPLRGSIWVLMASSGAFLLCALGMGLVISTVSKNQFVAGQIAIIVTYLPAFMLSGFIFDLHSMPVVIQWITHIVAARYFVTILQSVFLAGNVWSVTVPNIIALLVMAAIFLGMARLMARKSLE